jgi:hypothetical protein
MGFYYRQRFFAERRFLLWMPGLTLTVVGNLGGILMENLVAVVLAAGEGKRLKSKNAKGHTQ